MSNHYPLSKQLERGQKFFGAMLAETPVCYPQAKGGTKTLPLTKTWGLFSCVNFTTDLLGRRHPEEPKKLSTFQPVVSMALRFGEEKPSGLVVAWAYEELAFAEEDFLDKHTLPGIKRRKLRPFEFELGFRHDFRREGEDDISIAEHGLRTDDENIPTGRWAAEILKRGMDVLEGLGSTGLRKSLVELPPSPVFATREAHQIATTQQT